MLVKSNTHPSRNKGAFSRGQWGTPLMWQGSAMEQGYSPHVSLANKWLFLLDIHWRNHLDLRSDVERPNLVSDLRSTYFGIIRRMGQIRGPSLLDFSLKHFTYPPLVTGGFQCHPAKSISNLFCFLLDDWWMCGSAHSVTQVLPPAKWRGLQSWASLCFQPNLSSGVFT